MSKKYALLNKNKLLQHLQMQLSQKRKTFSSFLFPFSRVTFNFKHFLTKDDRHSSCIFELTDSQKHY